MRSSHLLCKQRCFCLTWWNCSRVLLSNYYLKAIDDLDLGNCSSLGFKRLPVSLDNISADFEIGWGWLERHQHREIGGWPGTWQSLKVWFICDSFVTCKLIGHLAVNCMIDWSSCTQGKAKMGSPENACTAWCIHSTVNVRNSRTRLSHAHMLPISRS